MVRIREEASLLAGTTVLEAAVGHQAAQNICLWTRSHAVFAARVPVNRMAGNVVNGYRVEVSSVCLYAVNMI
jgi:hypothetical protein